MCCARMQRNHEITYFFECSYTSQVWEHLTKEILGDSYSNGWNDIALLLSDEKMEKRRLFCIHYAFQAAIYTLWRERNRLKHGEKLLPMVTLKKLIDKRVRNKLSLMRSKRLKGMEGGLQFWFSTRI